MSLLSLLEKLKRPNCRQQFKFNQGKHALPLFAVGVLLIVRLLSEKCCSMFEILHSRDKSAVTLVIVDCKMGIILMKTSNHNHNEKNRLCSNKNKFSEHNDTKHFSIYFFF